MHQHCANELLGIVMPLCRSSFSFMAHCVGRRQWHPGRQPWQMKATESTEQDFSPFSSLTSTSKSISTSAQCWVLGLLQISSPTFTFPFISCHFLSAGGTQTQMGGPCFTCADSTAAEQDFPGFTEQISRLLHTGLSSIHLILFLPMDPLWRFYKWSQTVPNIALKICRFATSPALFSSRTSSIYWKLWQLQDRELLHVLVLHSLCWEMLWNVDFSNDSSFKPFSVLLSFLINRREAIFLQWQQLSRQLLNFKNTDGACHFFFSAAHCIPHLTCGTCLVP